MRALPFILFLAACSSRPLSVTETQFAQELYGEELDYEEIAITRGSVLGLISATVPPRPRETCREKLFPPRDEPATGSFAAFVLGNRIHYTRDAWQPDFLKEYPKSMDLREAMRLAHELVHVWQWQHRTETGYFPTKALTEHVESDDPYLTEIDPDRAFLDYGWEQQGIVMEEFVCCRALDPSGQRTAQLRNVLSPHFPNITAREITPISAIRLPWDGAELSGICS